MEDASDLKLSMGFIAVRNRTQEEVAAGEPLSRVRARERAFFEGHAELGSLARQGSKLLGMESLERRLARALRRRRRPARAPPPLSGAPMGQ